MESREGDHSEFISYLYSNHPKPIGSIDLELPLEEDRKNIYLHVFEQLLMIFVDGLKYFFSDDNDKVRLTDLTEDNIQKLNDYFHSMNYHITIEIYPTIFEYQFRYPNYFKDQSLIDEKVQLEDFFYETYDDTNCAYRVFFKKLV